MTNLTIGQAVPKFTLIDQGSQKVSLSDFLGQPLVIYFYPKASTPGCTVQACGLRDVQNELKKLKTCVIGISPDSVTQIKKFHDKQSLNFPLLADEDHAVADQFGVWQQKKFMGKTHMGVVRTTFIVDAKGRLASVLPAFKTANHHTLLLSHLSQLAL
jgi:thioredoxin-dependent peroxiredoxin